MPQGQRTCAFQRFLKDHPRDCSGIPHLLANLLPLSEASGICKGVWLRKKCAIACLPVPLEPRKKIFHLRPALFSVQQRAPRQELWRTSSASTMRRAQHSDLVPSVGKPLLYWRRDLSCRLLLPRCACIQCTVGQLHPCLYSIYSTTSSLVTRLVRGEVYRHLLQTHTDNPRFG